MTHGEILSHIHFMCKSSDGLEQNCPLEIIALVMRLLIRPPLLCFKAPGGRSGSINAWLQSFVTEARHQMSNFLTPSDPPPCSQAIQAFIGGSDVLT